MKNLLTLVVLAFAVNAAMAQSTLPNGDMENWHTVTLSQTLSYEDLGTDTTDTWMGTLNALVGSPSGPGPVTVFKTEDKYSGTYAAKAVSATLALGPFNIFIPGMIGTAKMDFNGVKALLGKPCADCKPLRFKGYYKFEPANGDSCAAVILLSQWNSTLKKRDTIGFGKFIGKERLTSYVPFDVPVTYYKTGTVDSLTLLVVASAGFNVINFQGAVGQPGTTMYVDELTLEYPAGIEQSLMPEVSVKTYPNPASDILHVDLSKELKNGVFEIYSTDGKLSGSFRLNGLNNTVSTGNLVSGTYHFRLMEGKGLMNTGSFVVNK